MDCTGEGNGKPLQSSCLENSMDIGAWQAKDHGIAKSWTRGVTDHAHREVLFHLLENSEMFFAQKYDAAL